MTDINAVKPENFRNVSVPLNIDLIKEFFDNKELFFLINYKDSKIQGNMFLTYISNLGLPSEIVFDGSTVQDKFDLLKFYMETRNLNESNTLRLAAAQIILESKGFDTSSFILNPIFTKAECLEFIKANSEMVKRWETFLTSSLLYIITSVKALDEEFKIKEEFKTIDDAHYVGSNIVQLCSIPGFLEIFFSLPCNSEIFYFKAQFEEYMFRGKNFFHYFNCPENTLLLVFNELITGDTSLEQVKEMLTGAI